MRARGRLGAWAGHQPRPSSRSLWTASTASCVWSPVSGLGMTMGDDGTTFAIWAAFGISATGCSRAAGGVVWMGNAGGGCRGGSDPGDGDKCGASCGGGFGLASDGGSTSHVCRSEAGGSCGWSVHKCDERERTEDLSFHVRIFLIWFHRNFLTAQKFHLHCRCEIK